MKGIKAFLFTILGTITLAGAGFVVTLKKAKQR